MLKSSRKGILSMQGPPTRYRGQEGSETGAMTYSQTAREWTPVVGSTSTTTITTVVIWQVGLQGFRPPRLQVLPRPTLDQLSRPKGRRVEQTTVSTRSTLIAKEARRGSRRTLLEGPSSARWALWEAT
jgi:hypothetical protein